jgi:hypothetical protein
MQEFPNLEAYQDRFQKLPAIEKYMKSDRSHSLPRISSAGPA